MEMRRLIARFVWIYLSQLGKLVGLLTRDAIRLEAIASRLEAIATSNKKLLLASCY